VVGAIDEGVWFRFLACALAVWRLTHLLAAEDGPWDLVLRLRRSLGESVLGKMMDCFNCLSLWVSLPFAFAVVEGWIGRIVAWLALSGAACLANRLGAEQVLFHPPPAGEP
jgi:hypothetical protein